MIFELSGTMSVPRSDRPIDPSLLTDVIGAELLDHDPRDRLTRHDHTGPNNRTWARCCTPAVLDAATR
ncbi:hypothetical protein HLB23_06800 [Nocardia uniformis]|uniref:Uncharacterized protein n=1 Tax=Nocardia uniformis TaxID=53432 RepID=A0A849BWQ5_9NOCA|nr:hypothetical protein [Nocardia uniformis]NNH69578.1 hypothetical protein [Nocardia uniformis]